MGQFLLRWWLGCLQFPQDMLVSVGSAGAVLHVLPGGGSMAYFLKPGGGSLARFCATFSVYSPETKTVMPLLRTAFLKSGRGFRVESAIWELVEVGGSFTLGDVHSEVVAHLCSQNRVTRTGLMTMPNRKR